MKFRLLKNYLLQKKYKITKGEKIMPMIVKIESKKNYSEGYIS